nr:hypothetical protein [Pseudomonas sp. BIGb0427]
MLIMHSAQARAKGELDDRGQTIFNIAIDADSKAAYQADGHDIELISARLTAGGEDTDSYGTTLSGVTFISDQNSGITVLYRPPSIPPAWYASTAAWKRPFRLV